MTENLTFLALTVCFNLYLIKAIFHLYFLKVMLYDLRHLCPTCTDNYMVCS